jgi:hypothetical protein
VKGNCNVQSHLRYEDMNKKLGLITPIFLFLLNCQDKDVSKVESLYLADLREKNKLLELTIFRRAEDFKRYHGFEMEFYSQIQENFGRFFYSVDHQLSYNATNRQDLYNNYKQKIRQVNSYCDSLKRDEPKHFLAEDANAMRLNILDSTSLFSVHDDSLFKQILSTDLKSQINEVSFISSSFGCKLGTYIDNGNFKDFFIVENVIDNNRTCRIKIKSRYINKHLQQDYDLSIKSVNKIVNNDTVTIADVVQLKKIDDDFETNKFSVTSGRYLFDFEFKYNNPNGTIKVGELSFNLDVN